MRRETERHVTSFFQILLALKSPWRALGVELKAKERSVEIAVKWPNNYKALCAECGRACAVYLHAGARSWRHLDTMNRMAHIYIRVPRSNRPQHRVKTMEVP